MSSSRAASSLADATDAGATSLGQQLGADYQLAGALLDGPDGPRLTLELLSVPTGQVRWVGEYSLPETGPDVLNARLEAANAIALTLGSRGGVVQRLEASESDLAASRASYHCVLRYYAYLQRRDPAEHALVRDCLETAGRDTPGYAEVWSSLAQVYLDEQRNGFTAGAPSGDPVDRAIVTAERAVTLSPDSASAQSVFAAAHYFARNIPAFRAAARRALELNPNDPDAHAYLGHLLSMSGDWPEGQRLVAQAQAMSPIHPPLWHHTTAMAAMLDEDYDRALAEAERGEMPRFYMSYVLLAAMHGHLGNRAEARQAVDTLEALRPDYLAVVEADMKRRHFQPDLIESFQRGLARAYAMADDK